jgi:hypothetical protein
MAESADSAAPLALAITVRRSEKQPNSTSSMSPGTKAYKELPRAEMSSKMWIRNKNQELASTNNTEKNKTPGSPCSGLGDIKKRINKETYT